jgi:hypothetical protein
VWVRGLEFDVGARVCTCWGVHVGMFKLGYPSWSVVWISWLPFFDGVSLPTTLR